MQFSRTRPPTVLIPTNENHLGARNVMIPVEYKPEMRRVRQAMKSRIIEHETFYEDSNKPKPMVLHPPYMDLQSLGTNPLEEPTSSDIIPGTQYSRVSFPILF